MRQKKGYSVVGLLGIILAIGIVVGVSIIVINRNRESQQVVEKREDTPINRREQNRIERDISNNLDNGLLPNIELPKVESQIVDNIEPIVNRRYIPRFRSLVNNKLAVNKPSIPNIPSIPSIPEQPSIPSIPNTPEIPVTPDIPTPPTPPTPPQPPLPPALLAGQKDPGFNTGVDPSDNSKSIIIKSNGKIIIGGPFNHYRGETANNIIGLNSDGTKDTSFDTGTGFNAGVNTLAIQDDVKILVGGVFTEYNGEVANYIARLNEYGSLDTTFDTGTGFNHGVETLAIQSDGKILVGGYFNEYNGEQANRIIRLNIDGTRDNTFDMGMGFNSVVRTIAQQADGKILVGGVFTEYNGEQANRIIRLNSDGSRDTSFNIGTGFNSEIETLAQQADGKILVGGWFTIYQGVGANRIARLNTDGSRDTSFDTGTGFDNGVSTLALQSDGKILIGGYFSSYQGVGVNRIIRLNIDGTRDNTFDMGMGVNQGNYAYVNTILVQSDGKILVGGYLNEYNGEQANIIIRLNADGSIDNNTFKSIRDYKIGFDDGVETITQQTDGKILVGGWFTQYNGEPANYIARLNEDGSRDTTFDTGSGFNSVVRTIAQQADGKIIVGGYFDEYNGEVANYIARLNEYGSLDTTFNTGTGFNGGVLTLIQQADGKIIVGGWFDQYNGETANRIARLNEDGSLDTSFNAGTGFGYFYPGNSYNYGYVSTLIQQADGKIIVGGYFDEYNGENIGNNIVRLNEDGSLDTSFNAGTGFGYFYPGNSYNYGYVSTLIQQADGKIIVGGYFDEYNGENIGNNIVRLNSDGSRDTTFDTSTSFNCDCSPDIYTMAIQSDGKIIVGGYYLDEFENGANGLIRLNTDGSRDTSFTGFQENDDSPEIYALAIQNDGKILVGGYFYAGYQGQPAVNLIRVGR